MHRIAQIEELLWAHPEGLSRARIAERLGVTRSVISKYLDHNDLPASIYEDDLDGGKLKVDRCADLMRVAFSLHEIAALHMATRLLATHMDKHNPHAASALRKLGIALTRFERNISKHLLDSADVMDAATAYRDPVYLQVLQTLTESWSTGCLAEIEHRKDNGTISRYLFAPYFIEPYAPGHSAYVIGRREPEGVVRTLKIERIRSARLTLHRYEIPPDFDVRALLEDAWGIWTSDGEPEEVVLRFHPRVAGRVRENRWHRSQRIEECADGSVEWHAQIAEPREMMPWVRGWGADCEVLAPAWLREELAAEAARLKELYK
jgi:predicted DNA-binding transcriptional regulator YafY